MTVALCDKKKEEKKKKKIRTYKWQVYSVVGEKKNEGARNA